MLPQASKVCTASAELDSRVPPYDEGEGVLIEGCSEVGSLRYNHFCMRMLSSTL